MQLPVGAALKGVCNQYGRFATILAPPGSAKAPVLKDSRAVLAAPAIRPAAAEQSQALYRISFSRSRQKRGPPSLPL